MMAAADRRPEQRRDNALVWWRVLPLIGLVGVVALVLFMGWHRLLTFEMVVSLRDQFQTTIAAHTALALIAFVAAYTCLVALSIPGALVFTLAGGLLFGWFLGGVAAVIGATIGASVLFGIARTALGESLVAMAGPQVNRLREGFKEDALSYMLFLRLVPGFPFFIVNLVPAILGVPFRTFLLGTVIGIIPGTFIFASVGAGLDALLATAKQRQMDCLRTKVISECSLSVGSEELKSAFLMLGTLSLLALIPLVVKKWRQRHGRQQ